jgi:hypothetical protein
MSNINKKIALVKKTIKINPEDIKISLENLIDDVNKKTSSIQKEVDDVFEKLNKLPGNKYQYKEKFVIDEEKPNFTNEIDELDYIHESLIFKYAQLEIKLKTLKNDYEKILKNHITILNEKNETLQKENNNLINYLQKAKWEYKLQEIHIDPPGYSDIETMYLNKVLKYKSLKNAIKYYKEIKDHQNIKCDKCNKNKDVCNCFQPPVPQPIRICIKCNANICRCNISPSLRRDVWNTHVGRMFELYRCLCCCKNIITYESFHCGHVISRHDGGSLYIANLRPICRDCNVAMGTMDMNKFRKFRGYDMV